MNEHRLPLTAVDGHVTLLSPDDAAALADAQAALDRITAASPETRQKIETLQHEELAAKAQAAMADVSGSRGTSRKAHFLRIRISEKLGRAQRAAVKEFARTRGWRFQAAFSASELHKESLSMTWCEDCGGLCQLGASHCVHTDHSSGKHDAFADRKDDNGRTEAVVHHTRHPLAASLAFAARFGFKVTQLDWSWYGLPSAVVFTRGRKS